jgi:GTP cyclohydrolase IB
MIDTQNQPDFRRIPIDKVGIKGLKYPVQVLDKNRGTQSTVAEISMYVDLPHQCKGTHMSRFVEILHQSRTKISLESLTTILADMKQILGAKSSHIEITFPYFISKQSPSAGVSGLMDYTCSIIGSSNAGNPTDIVLRVAVPVTSVCPCSKEISDCGAHNQRGEVLVSARFKN